MAIIKRTIEQVQAELTKNVSAAIRELEDITGMSVISANMDLVDVKTFGDDGAETVLTDIKITYE